MSKRLAEYEEKTAPLVAYYEKQGNAVHVNALGDIDDVTRAIIFKLPDGEPATADP